MFKSAAVATLLTGLVVLVGAIALAKPAFARAADGTETSMVSINADETAAHLALFDSFKNSNPAPTPGAVVLFGAGGVLIFTTQRKFAKV